MNIAEYVLKRIDEMHKERDQQIDTLLLDIARTLIVKKKELARWISTDYEMRSISCLLCGKTLTGRDIGWTVEHEPDCPIHLLQMMEVI